MEIDFNSGKPIFQQVADGIEDAILTGAFPEGGQIPSITEFSVNYTINPATALKGINLLVDEGTVYKKRGVGMFVADGAVELIKWKRRGSFAHKYVTTMVKEAKRLDLSPEELSEMIRRAFEESGEEPREKSILPGKGGPSG